MKKNKLILIFLLVSMLTNAQDNGSFIILKASFGGIKNSSFHKYTPPFKAKIIYKDTLQAVNKYPEQLMSSVMSENSEAWHNYNNSKAIEPLTEGKPRFKKVKKLNKDKNYFELLHKLEFTSEGIQYAIIKFNLVLEENNKPFQGAYLLVKNNERWYRTSKSQFFSLTLLNMFFKTNRLEEIFFDIKNENLLLDDLRKKITNNDVIDLQKLIDEFNSWYKNKDTEKIEFFTNK